MKRVTAFTEERMDGNIHRPEYDHNSQDTSFELPYLELSYLTLLYKVLKKLGANFFLFFFFLRCNLCQYFGNSLDLCIVICWYFQAMTFFVIYYFPKFSMWCGIIYKNSKRTPDCVSFGSNNQHNL